MRSFIYFLTKILFFWGFSLLTIGSIALLFRNKSFVFTLILLELLLLGLAQLFLASSLLLNSVAGEMVLFLLLTLGGAESGIGLAILMQYYATTNNLAIPTISALKY